MKSLVGIVYYADDPLMTIRIVTPTKDDKELDGPPTDHRGAPILQDDGTPHTWASLPGSALLDTPGRVKVFEKVSPNDHRVNFDRVIAKLAELQPSIPRPTHTPPFRTRITKNAPHPK